MTTWVVLRMMAHTPPSMLLPAARNMSTTLNEAALIPLRPMKNITPKAAAIGLKAHGWSKTDQWNTVFISADKDDSSWRSSNSQLKSVPLSCRSDSNASFRRPTNMSVSFSHSCWLDPTILYLSLGEIEATRGQWSYRPVKERGKLPKWPISIAIPILMPINWKWPCQGL